MPARPDPLYAEELLEFFESHQGRGHMQTTAMIERLRIDAQLDKESLGDGLGARGPNAPKRSARAPKASDFDA